MTPVSTIHDLENFLTLLLRSEVARATTKVVALRGVEGFQRVTWATNSSVPGELFRNESASVSEYREWLRRQGYSALLFDGSIIQISYDFNYTGLIGHRLVYFPCPFNLESELMDLFDLVEIIDMYSDQDVAKVRLRSPVRFDFDIRSAAGASHPVSHMTFQWSYTRVPVMAPISLGHFVQFIFRSFYPKMWQVHDFIRDWPLYKMEQTITSEDRNMLHIHSFA